MIKGVLFDLDNTLIDFMTMKERCTEAAVSAMIDAGLKMPKKKAYSLLMKMYKEYGIEEHQIYEKFLENVSGKIDYKILSAGIIAYRHVKLNKLVPYPNVKSTLLKLKKKGLVLGIVSDAPRLQAWLRLTEMNLVKFFDVVIGFEDTKKIKPSIVPFKKALKQMELKPSEVIFVGDNPKRDIVGAKKVGMQTCLAKYGQIVKGNGADFEIEDIQSLISFL